MLVDRQRLVLVDFEVLPLRIHVLGHVFGVDIDELWLRPHLLCFFQLVLIGILDGGLFHLSDDSPVDFFAGAALLVLRVLFIENHTLLIDYKYSL